ncbi:MAG: hypothetical protein HYZ53_16490 [Planctomycetes bacterium]|nr:hypothetical protein [Planctomycetota bacterium]
MGSAGAAGDRSASDQAPVLFAGNYVLSLLTTDEFPLEDGSAYRKVAIQVRGRLRYEPIAEDDRAVRLSMRWIAYERVLSVDGQDVERDQTPPPAAEIELEKAAGKLQIAGGPESKCRIARP